MVHFLRPTSSAAGPESTFLAKWPHPAFEVTELILWALAELFLVLVST